jgi:hypothetical protein
MTAMDLISLFAGRYPIFTATFVEGVVFSPSYVYGDFVKNKVGIIVWIHIQVFYSVPLVFLSVFESVLHLLLWL